MSKPIIVLCTAPDNDCAQKIARELVANNLAACCNIIPGLTSIYKWDAKVQQDSELLLMIKSTKHNFELIKEKIKTLHPYKIPEIISVDITQGSKQYIDWIFNSVKGKNEN